LQSYWSGEREIAREKKMAIVREFDESNSTVIFLYRGQPITPEINTKDPEQILAVLSLALEKAYQKLRDAGID
jgi:hypothetical protein